MIRLIRSLGLTRPSLLTLLIVCLAPAAASAESIRFRNETAGPVIVKTSCIIRGAVQQGPTFLLNPMDVTPAIVLPGNKIITICDGPRNPNRVLFQGTIPAGTDDLSFGIVTDVPPPRVKLEARRFPPR